MDIFFYRIKVHQEIDLLYSKFTGLENIFYLILSIWLSCFYTQYSTFKALWFTVYLRNRFLLSLFERRFYKCTLGLPKKAFLAARGWLTTRNSGNMIRSSINGCGKRMCQARDDRTLTWSNSLNNKTLLHFSMKWNI